MLRRPQGGELGYTSEDLRYPIGPFRDRSPVSSALRAEWIDTLERAPQGLPRAVDGLNDAQLDTPYRPEGWSSRQVVHQLADSHMNSYIRIKLALTEDTPDVRGYDEVAWAELPEARTAPLELSLALIDSLHARWGGSRPKF